MEYEQAQAANEAGDELIDFAILNPMRRILTALQSNIKVAATSIKCPLR